MLGNYLDEVRKKAPLIHNITNYVTINDVANMVLACGASPIMSDEPTDIEEITSICQGLNINMGMLNPRKIESMQKAGKKSNELHHKVLLDPVGAGSSSFRTEAALNLIRDIQFDVIRGNIYAAYFLEHWNDMPHPDLFLMATRLMRHLEHIIEENVAGRKSGGRRQGIDRKLARKIRQKLLDPHGHIDRMRRNFQIQIFCKKRMISSY